MLLHQVIHDDAPSLRKLNSNIPKDLETICLKCLQKETARRYSTAVELSIDLLRFQRREPIAARPIGRLERGWRWCRRNRAVAGLTAAVALALIAGAVTSSYFALKERDHAVSESIARQDALTQKGIAEQQEEEAQLQARAAVQARDDMQSARQAAEDNRNAADEARGRAETALYFNRVSLADKYWLADNLSVSRRLLDECPLDRRGFEWHFLDRLHHADLLTLPGNGQFTTSLKFSSDGKRMAAFSQYGDPGVRIWDLTTHKPLTEITYVRQQRQFTCAELSTDGTIVALGDQAGTISFWDAKTGQIRREFARLPKSVGSLSFSPDGKWLAAARADGRNGERLWPITEPSRNEDLVVWDVDSGAEVFHPKGYGYLAQFSPDGSRLVTFKSTLRLTQSSPESVLALFDTAGWTEVAAGKLGSASSFSFSGFGKRLAVGGLDRQSNAHFVRVLNPATGHELANLTPGPPVGDIALSRNGLLLAIAGSLGRSQIDVWDVKQKRIIRALRGHTSYVSAVTFAPDGRIASSSFDNTIKFWNTTSGRLFTQIPGRAGLADPVVFAPGGDLLAYGQRNTINLFTGPEQTITLVDAATGNVSRTLPGHEGGANCLAFNGDGVRLVSGGRKGDVKVWDTKITKSICTVRGGDGEIVAVALSPDGRTGASTHEPPETTRFRRGEGQYQTIPVAIKVWDADSGSEQATLTGHRAGVHRLAFGPDGKVLASAGGDGVKFWDLAAGTELKGLDQTTLKSSTFTLLQFSPGGDRLLTSGSANLQLWDTATGRSMAEFPGHRIESRNAVAISHDQTRMATISNDDVKLWNMRTGLEILTLPMSDPVSGHKLSVIALQWTSDGQRLRGALSDGGVLTWDGSPRP